MGKVSIAVGGNEFVDFVQKKKNTFYEEDGSMRLIKRDKRWFLEDSETQEPLAFSELGDDLDLEGARWKIKEKDSAEFVDATIKIRVSGKKTVRTFGKSMKQKSIKKKVKPRAQPSTEPRKRSLKRSLRDIDVNSGSQSSGNKRRKTNNHEEFTFTAFDEKYNDDEFYMMRLQQDMYVEAKKKEMNRIESPTEFYPIEGYLEMQPNIPDEESRIKALIDVIQVCFSLKMQKHTFHLAVRLFDRYASIYELKKDHLKVLPWACFSIAVKYVEVETVSMAAYSRWDVQEEHVIHLERQVFQTVELRVDDLLPYHFAERFFLLIVSEIEKTGKQTRAEKFHTLLWYLLDLAMLEYKMLKYAKMPSKVAAACVCLACTITQELEWSKNQTIILQLLDCSSEELEPIVKELTETIKDGDLARISGLMEEYGSANCHRISIRLKEYFEKSDEKKRKTEEENASEQ